MNLPGYDAWKTDLTGTPYEGLTEAQEREAEEQAEFDEQALRDAVCGALDDYRGTIYLATIRRIVIEELNKLAPRPGEPDWQTKTPVPIPALG